MQCACAVLYYNLWFLSLYNIFHTYYKRHVFGRTNKLLHTKSLRLSRLVVFSLVTVQNTICGRTRSCSPDDGHNDARNMLR